MKKDLTVTKKSNVKILKKANDLHSITEKILLHKNTYLSNMSDNYKFYIDLKQNSWILSLVITPDGKYIVSCSKDGNIRLWSIQSGENIHTFRGHSHAVFSVAVTPDGK